MMCKEQSMRHLGRRVAHALGDGPPERDQTERRAQVITRFVQGTPTAEPSLWPRAVLYGGVAAAIACVVVLTVMTKNNEEMLRFRIGDSSTPGDEGDWVHSANQEIMPVRFDGGTVIDFAGGSRARVTRSREAHVHVELVKGKVEARVKKGGTKWQIAAGPFTVTVLGTRFDMSWNPENSSFEVAVSQGVVRVTGSGLGAYGVEVTAGKRMTASDADRIFALLPLDRKSALDPAVSQGRADGQESSVIEAESIAPAVPSTGSSRAALSRSVKVPHGRDAGTAEPPDAEPAGPQYHEIMDRGDYVSAIAALERAGIDEQLSSLNSETLWLLADAARYTGNGKIAKRLLLAQRERFAGTERARRAAFLLGRVEVEIRNNPESGARWFETYLEESPRGSLAQEALGRLVDSNRRAGTTDKARAAANRYLTLYPDGMYAPLARDVIKN